MCAVGRVRAYRHTQLAYRHTQNILEDEGTVAGPLQTVGLRIPQTPGHVEEAGKHVDANECMEPAFRVRPDTFHHATTEANALGVQEEGFLIPLASGG